MKNKSIRGRRPLGGQTRVSERKEQLFEEPHTLREGDFDSEEEEEFDLENPHKA